ncbi:two-component system response regulator [Kocuria polaris]|nr:two-component system response regulator [Kocuria polaris]
MITVLIVDDDVRVARNHRELVESLPGYVVADVAHTGAEALAAVRREKPDLVLLDLFLPDRFGLSLLQELRGPGSEAEFGVVDVLVVSALRDIEYVRSALHSGAVYYLIKPFSLATLRDQLERYAAAQKKLDSLQNAVQGDIDAVLGMLRPRAAAQLPKGLTSATAARVAETLRGADGDLSAVEVSEQTGIARVTARRYLEHLCTEGRAELSLRYGSGGRPEHRYRWVS